MAERGKLREFSQPSSRERLIAAVLDLWETQGHAALSARNLAQSAELPVSSIYHHFGGLEQLFLSAQAAARDQAERWCAQRIDALAGADALPADALAPLLATMIDDWSQGERRLAFAWRECHMLAARDPHFQPALESWHALWSGFWTELCGRCGLGDFATATAHIFDGESVLHMMRWRRPVDRGALDELCRGWGRWLSGALAEEGPWRRFAREEAGRTTPDLPVRGGTAAIAAAAADALEHGGVAGLTHRAVAARAGVTLGVVSYNFRTSADLARAAFETIYRRIVPGAESGPPLVSREAALAGMGDVQIAAPLLLAMDELLLAVARDPDLRAFAPQLRYLRGRSSGAALQAMLGDNRPISPLDAALYSGFLSGQRRALIGKPSEDCEADARRTVGLLIGAIGNG